MTQNVTVDLIRNAQQFEWSAANIALGAFAKLGGTPWTVVPCSNRTSLILGVGRTEKHDPTSRMRKRSQAYATCISSVGHFGFVSIYPEVTEDAIPGSLETATLNALKEAEKLQLPFDSMVIHPPSPRLRWAGVSYVANTADAAANMIPIVGTGKALVENGVKSGIKAITSTLAKDAAEDTPNIVYRALNDADAKAIANGEGLIAKAPNGTWTASEHVANSGPGIGGASANSPWISTSSRLDVAQAYDSGNGVIAIDLNQVSSFQTQVWQYAPRVNGVQGLPFQRSFWAQETTIFQTIPANAIIGFVK